MKHRRNVAVRRLLEVLRLSMLARDARWRSSMTELTKTHCASWRETLML